MSYTITDMHRAESARFERDLARWEAEHTDPNEGEIAPIRGGSEDHGRPFVSLYKREMDPWTALLTPEQRAAAAADVPF